MVVSSTLPLEVPSVPGSLLTGNLAALKDNDRVRFPPPPNPFFFLVLSSRLRDDGKKLSPLPFFPNSFPPPSPLLHGSTISMTSRPGRTSSSSFQSFLFPLRAFLSFFGPADTRSTGIREMVCARDQAECVLPLFPFSPLIASITLRDLQILAFPFSSSPNGPFPSPLSSPRQIADPRRRGEPPRQGLWRPAPPSLFFFPPLRFGGLPC